MLKKSEGIVSYVVKEVAKSIFTGRGVVGISLPVRIFEPRSALERVLDGFSYAPTFLSQACKMKNPVDRIKNVIAFVISGMYMRANQCKPFNPLLGETLEGEYSDGTKIFMEHTSHHPPISNYLLEGPKSTAYKFHGNNEFVGNIKNSGNILNILFKGPNVVDFPDGSRITFHNHINKVKGLMWGDKVISMEGCLTVHDEENGIKASIIMAPKKFEVEDLKDPNQFEGLIYYTTGDEVKKDPEFLSKILDVDEEICKVHGSWVGNLVIDGTTFWDIDTGKPNRIQFPKHCLPSDPRYREDLIWLSYKDEKFAQEWKNLLEIQQRKERKNRLAIQKKRKGKLKFIENV